MQKMLTVPQAAARWGVSRQRVHQWIIDGRVAVSRPGREYLIPSSARKPRPKKGGRPRQD